MMDEELKQKIRDNVEEDVYIPDHEEFERQLSGECYKIDYGEFIGVVIKGKGHNCLRVNYETGKYEGLEDYEYAKQHGELL